ncbi:FAD synthase [Blattella germanica]|nr:FAD synthase [Blattella germanica]
MCLRLPFTLRTIFNGKQRFVFFRSKNWSSNTIVNKEEPRSAGIIVIGDEVLKGQVHDTNSHFIVKNMYKLGVKVQKITVVGDDEDTIAAEVKTFSEKYSYVITTGGIGPTHDDVTFKLPHPELVKLISHYYKTEDLNSAPMKMAHVPSSAKLIYGFDKTKDRKTLFPNVSIRNVYMFPGIPELMEKLFLVLSKDLFGGGSTQFFKRELYLKASEANIAKHLNTIVEEFPEIEFDIVEYDGNPLEQAYEKLLRVINTSKNSAYKRAVDTIEDCLKKFSPEEICVYFDGSNEAVSVLHIYYALILQRDAIPVIQAVSVKETERKQDLQSFINESISRYNLRFEVLENQCQKTNCLRIFDENTSYSDINWITPLIDWNSDDVRQFMESLTLPYYTHSDRGK